MARLVAHVHGVSEIPSGNWKYSVRRKAPKDVLVDIVQ
jgi:hypothetical protein